MHVLAVAENIFFLVLVAIIGLIRWMMAASESAKNAKAQKRASPPTPNAPVQRAPTQSEEERVRRFMEALGVPTSNAPPPKTQRRQVVPKIPRPVTRRVPPIDPFPRPRSTIWNPEPVVIAPAPVVIPAPPPIPESAPATATMTIAKERAAAPVFEVQVIDGRVDGPVPATEATALVRQTAVTSPGNWAARLANPDSLRDAIILREIFGPPRGMPQNLALPN